MRKPHLKWSQEALKGELSHLYHSFQSTQTTGRRKIKIILTREDINHTGILCPAFKKKKKDLTTPATKHHKPIFS